MSLSSYEGDLGSSAKEVEAALQTNFALANRWGCILLLDEADVFLAKRNKDDVKRNGLVSGKSYGNERHFNAMICSCLLVFLRILEYYPGNIPVY